MIFNDLRTGIELVKRLYDRTMDPVCARHNVTHMELDVLMFLASSPGMDTATHLVEMRRMPKSHVSMSVGTLTARGLLERAYLEGNRKTAHLSPSPDADAIIADGREAQQAFFAALCAGMSPAELKAVSSIARHVLKNLQNALE